MLLCHVTWFFMFLEVLHPCLLRLLLKFLLTAFGGERTFTSPARDSQAFSDFLWLHLLIPHFFFPLVAELWNLYPFPGSCIVTDSALTAFLLFSHMWPKSSSMYSLPGLQIEPTFCVCSLAVCHHPLMPLSGSYTGSLPQGRARRMCGVEGREACIALWVPMGKLELICGEALPAACGHASWWNESMRQLEYMRF